MSRREFKILEEIAEGGFGKVYLAELISADQQFSRVVALKVLHSKWSTHDEVHSRMRDEARLLGLLRNDHIVKVEDLTSINGQAAIVMEYLEGVDLKWLIRYLRERGESCPYRSVFEIVQASADALDSAYNGVPLQSDRPLRVIHRDIKPSNVVVTTTGQVKVLDFGTARAHFAERESKTGELAFGSQGYMSPERVLGESDTPAADVFSLGITMYELLALDNFGKIPLRPARYEHHLDQRLAALPRRGPRSLTEPMVELLSSMLAYPPEVRPSAARIVEVTDQLANEAKDVSLRKFARTVVVEARAAVPSVTLKDSLAGHVVKEDISASQPLPNYGHDDDDEDLAPTVAREVVPGDVPPSESSPREVGATDATGARPRGRRLVLALSMVGGFVVASGLLAVIAMAVYFIVSALVPRDFVVQRPGDVAEAVVRTTFTADATGPVVVRLNGDRGFLGEWNGPRPVTVRLAPGTYQTFISPTDAEPIRGRSFDLTGTECTVTLNLEAEAWSTRCN